MQLPSIIRFFMRVKHSRVAFPFPPSLSEDKYLLTAQTILGHEEAGPVAHVQFDPAHVIGLLDHQLLSFVQLVIEVPSTDKVNPSLHPTRLNFHPRHGTQLHSSGRGGAGTIEMPRIIITVFPHLVSRAAHREAESAASVALHGEPLTPTAASSTPQTSPSHGRRTGSPAKPPSTKSSFGAKSSPAKSPDRSNVASSPGSPMAPSKSGGLIPPLTTSLSCSIGSPYRSRGGKGLSGKSELFGTGDWARAAVALTERARMRPYALSKPGPTRGIPDILLANSAVSVASAKRLFRSSAKLGVEALRDLSGVVGRAVEGYVLSKAEKRQLRRAAELEIEVELADKHAEETAAAEAANPHGEESGIAARIKKAEAEAELKRRMKEAEDAVRAKLGGVHSSPAPASAPAPAAARAPAAAPALASAPAPAAAAAPAAATVTAQKSPASGTKAHKKPGSPRSGGKGAATSKSPTKAELSKTSPKPKGPPSAAASKAKGAVPPLPIVTPEAEASPMTPGVVKLQ